MYYITRGLSEILIYSLSIFILDTIITAWLSLYHPLSVVELWKWWEGIIQSTNEIRERKLWRWHIKHQKHSYFETI